MDQELIAALEDARAAGLLGPGPVEEQVEHSEALVALIDPSDGPVVDLGSGGGLPGLVLACAWTEAAVILLDARRRAGALLGEAVVRLGLADRVQVVVSRAEDAARDPSWRGHCELVVARAFGPPAVTAECAVGFLRAEGRLAVSEPPDADPATRWPAGGLEELGLTGPEVRHSGGATVALLTASTDPADRWPRRAGMPGKRPLWRASA